MGCISIAITEYVCPVRTLTFYPIPFIFSVSLNDSRMFEPKHYLYEFFDKKRAWLRLCSMICS